MDLKGGGRGSGLRALCFVLVHAYLHKAPLPGLQHCAGLLLAPANVMCLIVTPEVFEQLAGTHQQEGALQSLCPGGGAEELEVEAALTPGGGMQQAFARAACYRVNSHARGLSPIPRRGGPTSAAVLGSL